MQDIIFKWEIACSLINCVALSILPTDTASLATQGIEFIKINVSLIIPSSIVNNLVDLFALSVKQDILLEVMDPVRSIDIVALVIIYHNYYTSIIFYY